MRWGCGDYQFLIRDGIRDSSAVAYLPPNQRAGGTGTITVRPYSLAVKIVTTKQSNGTPAAVGIEFVDVSQGEPTSLSFAHAKREILVSGGTVNTPRLLKLSGIGSEKVLKAAGIPVVSDLPAVGKHLMDGVYVIMQVSIT